LKSICSLLLLFTVALSGCTTNPPETVRPDETKSAIEYTKILSKASSYALDVLLVNLGNETLSSSEYIVFKTWWCPQNAGVNSTDDVIQKYSQLCYVKGGIYIYPFCRNRSSNDEILFYSSVINSRKCTSIQTAEVVVIEPTGSRTAENYIRALRSAGYATTDEIKQRNQVAETIRNQIRIENERTKERDAVLMKNIGTRICQNDRSSRIDLTYIGFVERVEDSKIQIRIVQAQIGKMPGMQPGGFQPSIIWDYPDNWYVCE